MIGGRYKSVSELVQRKESYETGAALSRSYCWALTLFLHGSKVDNPKITYDCFGR